ncbi:MAG: hypothetical protein ACFNX6_12830 [Lautropia mirabilis]
MVHFAAETHVDASLRDPAAFVHSNVVGTFALKVFGHFATSADKGAVRDKTML